MEDLKEILEKRLEEKQKYYDKNLRLFLSTVENDSTTGCFERNAVTDLMALNQVKGEIRQIKNIIMLITLCKKG